MTPIGPSLIIPRPVVESMARLVGWRFARYLWRAHYDELKYQKKKKTTLY